MSDLPAGYPGLPFSALTVARIADDRHLRNRLRRVAASGCELVDDCTSASVTIIQQHRPLTAASTNEDARALERVQYAARAGPSLSAAKTGQAIRIDVVGVESRWPAFVAEAKARGVRSVLSMPLMLSAEIFGGLNLYGPIDGAFSDDDVLTARECAARASVVISNAQAKWASYDQSGHLTAAMKRRVFVEQAKGILRARSLRAARTSIAG